MSKRENDEMTLEMYRFSNEYKANEYKYFIDFVDFSFFRFSNSTIVSILARERVLFLRKMALNLTISR